jgi:hypothetical protein
MIEVSSIAGILFCYLVQFLREYRESAEENSQMRPLYGCDTPDSFKAC